MKATTRRRILDRPEFVRYDKHVGSTSIQNRFEKIDDLKTEAVFHVDDDVRIPCGKLQKGFREWQRNREGLVGYFGRMHKLENRNGGVDGTCKMRYAWNDVELFSRGRVLHRVDESCVFAREVFRIVQFGTFTRR